MEKKITSLPQENINFATWNVRSLLENSGDARIFRSRPQGASQNPPTVDRKLDLLMRELTRYNISVAGIHETKWFGSDIWTAEGYTFLHSGRPLPSDGDQAVRNEGVGIALDRKATEAWKAAGKKWEAVSSRVVIAHWQDVVRDNLEDQGQGQALRYSDLCLCP